MLSQFCNDHQSDWDTFIPYVTHAYRTSVRESTYKTPFFANHLRDALMPSAFAQEFTRFKSVDHYKSVAIANLHQAWSAIRDYSERIQQKREGNANMEHREHEFKIGDLVWLYTKRTKKGQSPKLVHPWHGPFRIIELPSPVNARLQDLQRTSARTI